MSRSVTVTTLPRATDASGGPIGRWPIAECLRITCSIRTPRETGGGATGNAVATAASALGADVSVVSARNRPVLDDALAAAESSGKGFEVLEGWKSCGRYV